MLIGNSNRWKVKPRMWGPMSLVQQSVWDNCENIFSIDPKHLILALPFWAGGGNKIYNYGTYADRTGILNGPVWKGDGLYLDGTDDQCYFADNDVFTPSDGLTVFARLLIETIPPIDNEGIISHYIGKLINDSTVSERSWAWVILPTAKMLFSANSDGTYQHENSATGDTALPSQTEVNLAAKWVKNDKDYVYYNGQEDGVSSSAPASLHNCTHPVYIGNYYYQYGHPDETEAMLNAVYFSIYLFSISLSDAQINLLHHRPYALFEQVKRPSYHFTPEIILSTFSTVHSQTAPNITWAYQLIILDALFSLYTGKPLLTVELRALFLFVGQNQSYNYVARNQSYTFAAKNISDRNY